MLNAKLVSLDISQFYLHHVNNQLHERNLTLDALKDNFLREFSIIDNFLVPSMVSSSHNQIICLTWRWKGTTFFYNSGQGNSSVTQSDVPSSKTYGCFTVIIHCKATKLVLKTFLKIRPPPSRSKCKM